MFETVNKNIAMTKHVLNILFMWDNFVKLLHIFKKSTSNNLALKWKITFYKGIFFYTSK